MCFWACQGKVAQDFHHGIDRANSNPNPDTLSTVVRGEIQSKGFFSYYVPKNLVSGSQTPVFIFFDPEGEGSEPLEKYRGIADSLGILLIGSLETKNGLSFEQTRQIASKLIDHTTREFKVENPNFYLVGFSGGAKVALDAAMHLSQVVGAVYCGAPGNAENITKPIFGFVGNRDMNFADCLHFEASLADSIPHALITWDGLHEWPPSSLFIRSMFWAAHRSASTLDSKVAQEYYAHILKQYHDHNDDPMKQAEILHEAWLLAYNSSKQAEAGLSLKKFIKSTVYKRAESSQERSLQSELAAKARYNNAFFEKDLDWWMQEVKILQKSTSPASKRMLAYFSLASYSLAQRALAQEQLDFLEKVLNIYELVDPENAEVYYLKAVYFAKLNRPAEVELALQKAKSKGFKDRNRVAQQVEFKSLVSENTLAQLFSK